MDLGIIFLTGLTVGGLSCLAVQGGLLASVIAAREDEEIEQGVNKKNRIVPTLAFLLAKLLAYTGLGFLLGMFGSVLGISQGTQIVMQLVAGIYMVVVALNLLNIHPIFRYAVIQPPRFLFKKVRNQAKNKDLFAPALLGAMTIFIPCGTTLAMEALAISSANPFAGSAIMAVFVLGTSPLFFGVGWLTSVLGDNYRAKFLKVAAIGVLYLGLNAINGSLVASGSPLSMQSLSKKLTSTNTEQIKSVSSQDSDGIQNVEITVTASGYTPRLVSVKSNKVVRLTLRSTNAYSCASAFRIPALGVARNLLPNSTEIIEFTPTKTGQIAFSCSMGMYTGVIDVR